MPLYKLTQTNEDWIQELDSANLTIGKDLQFVRGINPKINPEHQELADQKWAMMVEESKGRLFDGALAHSNKTTSKAGIIQVHLAKTTYKDHHVTTYDKGFENDQLINSNRPIRHERTDSRINHIVVANPQNFCSAYAIAIFLTTKDNKIFYAIRSSNTDDHKDQLSMPSGGRMSGDPHQFVDDVTTNNDLIYKHIKGTLKSEFPQLKELEKRVADETIKSTGIIRYARLPDLTHTFQAHIDANFNELEQTLIKGKYQGAGFVENNSDGIIKLLKKTSQFPGTISPTFILKSQDYSIDPKYHVNGLMEV
jgi:hypothetical protein